VLDKKIGTVWCKLATSHPLRRRRLERKKMQSDELEKVDKDTSNKDRSDKVKQNNAATSTRNTQGLYFI
jgi:hypothetical protein